MFYTVPVREREREYQNSILAFLCQDQAREYCSLLKQDDCKTQTYTIDELVFYSLQLCIPVAIVCNSYCDGTQIEPIYDIDWRMQKQRD